MTNRDTSRRWISGIAVMVAAVVSLFGFWHLSPGVTFIVAVAALGAMIFFLWLSGRP